VEKVGSCTVWQQWLPDPFAWVGIPWRISTCPMAGIVESETAEILGYLRLGFRVGWKIPEFGTQLA
jgi:hypothetical protein